MKLFTKLQGWTVIILLGVSTLFASEPSTSLQAWGPIRVGDNINLVELGGFYSISKGDGFALRAEKSKQNMLAQAPGQLGFIVRRIEVQDHVTFLVLGLNPQPNPQVNYETWVPVAFIRQVKLWGARGDDDNSK